MTMKGDPKRPEDAPPSPRVWWGNPGVVYFVGVGEPLEAIKIGMAAITSSHTLKSCIQRRLSQIQSSNHELIRLLGVVHITEGEFPTWQAESLERRLHNDFHDCCRFKSDSRGGEWFDATPSLLARIQDIATPPQTLDLPEHFSARRTA